ncbi:MAG: restriction endonuclease subunit S, partial [Defluviitaleaceae bacterium]|nr:restriction endonuclease subunit S [Defluviitaleaceae bacterium]
DIWKRTLHVAFPKKINLGEINQVDIVMPSSIDEQSHIGQFFRTLDESITNQQAKLDRLKQLKKAYLQKMFV